MKLLAIAVLLLAVGCSADRAAPVVDERGGQGTDIGGATEDRPLESGSAWFVGREPVRFCVVGDPARKSRFREAVESSFAAWREYAQSKRLFGDRPDEWKVSLAAVAAECGSEDLKVYFGTSDAEVERHRAILRNPFAFAQRTHYDPSTGKGRGFIWIDGRAPWDGKRLDWAHPAVDAILLHELGHTLGNAHVPGTVMDEGYAKWLAASGEGSEQSSWWATRIDFGRELVVAPRTRYTSRSADFDQLADLLRALFGDWGVARTSAPRIFLERGERDWSRIIVDMGQDRFYRSLETDRDPRVRVERLTSLPVFRVVKGGVERSLWSRTSLTRVLARNSDNEVVHLTIEDGLTDGGDPRSIGLEVESAEGKRVRLLLEASGPASE